MFSHLCRRRQTAAHTTQTRPLVSKHGRVVQTAVCRPRAETSQQAKKCIYHKSVLRCSGLLEDLPQLKVDSKKALHKSNFLSHRPIL